MPDSHVRHFAAKVAERRRRLGMTLTEVHANGGPTAPTFAKAEAAALDDPRPSTLSKFDAGLKWSPGSAARLYWEGGEPQPATPKPDSAPLAPAPDTIALSVDHVLALMSTQTRLQRLVANSTETVRRSDIKELSDSLSQQISAIVGTFVTELLERNRADEGTVLQPLIRYAFGELLSAPVGDDDPQREEKLYRRWLAGETEELPADLAATIERRWQERQGRTSA